ncbi:MAG: M23 family metallopeptidase [Panacagrimonas sp.]
MSALLALSLAVPQAGTVIPVQSATSRDWNPQSFWFEPWGRSGVHKGIDIFAPKGRPVRSATPGVVVFTGHLRLGGNTVAVLGPRLRLHYYAHLDAVTTRPLRPLVSGSVIGTVGTSGNAAGKPPHLHYAVLTLLPYPWRATTGTQGWKRMFYLDPGAILTRYPVK